MSQKEMYEQWLEVKLPTGLNQMAETMADILEPTVPLDMRLNIAHSLLATLASEFQIRLALPDGASIPTNSIHFSLSGSGSGKDSSEQKAKRLLSPAWELIDERRNLIVTDRAEAAWELAELDDSEHGNFMNKFMRKHKPKPLFVSVSTEQGLVKYLNQLETDGLGCGYLFSGELGTELTTSQDIVSNIKLLAEVYDSGQKKIRVLKSEEHQSGSIDFMPFNALLMSSPEVVIYDEDAKRKFKQEFISKLARRSFFNYNIEAIEKAEFSSVDAMLHKEREAQNNATQQTSYVEKMARHIAQTLLESGDKVLTLSDDVWDTFTVKRALNEIIADEMKHSHPISEKARRHEQWRTLKLAGALAIINHPERLVVEIEDYAEAICFSNRLDGQLAIFEEHLQRQPYELFIEYSEMFGETEPLAMSNHTLAQHGFIKPSQKPAPQIETLIEMSNTASVNGIFIKTEEGVRYEPKILPKFGASFMVVTGTKEERATKVHTGFKYKETEWSSLSKLLVADTAYSPFQFRDGNALTITSPLELLGLYLTSMTQELLCKKQVTTYKTTKRFLRQHRIVTTPTSSEYC